jgi:adenylate cyclase class IV
MEYEVRFYYPSSEVNNLLDKLSELKELEKKPRTYEKTVQYNHSDPRYDFYSKEIDGRFRLRLSKNIEESKCKLSWKRRLPNTTENLVNKEEEKEVRISYEDVDNFIFIIENVMHFKVVDSYERYRTIFTNEDVEISIDEYPFGIALEIENKSSTKNPEEVVMNYASKLKLNIKDSYRLSWDDKYVELCKEQNKKIYNEVTFDKDMPSI